MTDNGKFEIGDIVTVSEEWVESHDYDCESCDYAVVDWLDENDHQYDARILFFDGASNYWVSSQELETTGSYLETLRGPEPHDPENNWAKSYIEKAIEKTEPIKVVNSRTGKSVTERFHHTMEIQGAYLRLKKAEEQT